VVSDEFPNFFGGEVVVQSVTLSRFSPWLWNAKDQLEPGRFPFPCQLEKKLKVQLDYKIPILGVLPLYLSEQETLVRSFG